MTDTLCFRQAPPVAVQGCLEQEMLDVGDQEEGGGWRGEVQEGGIPEPETEEGQWWRGAAVRGSLPPFPQAVPWMWGEAPFVEMGRPGKEQRAVG